MKKLLIIGFIVMMCLSAIIGALLGVLEGKYHIPSMVLIAEIAERKAGKPIPFDPGSTGSMAFQSFGNIYFNSTWAEQWTFQIVPYFNYEGIKYNPNYPVAVLFSPLEGERHFHTMGYANPAKNFVIVNQRYDWDEMRNDERSALSVLVHELIHLQGAAFIEGESEVFEARTQSATLEVLAALCQHGREIGCKAFWYDLADYPEMYLRLLAEKHGLMWLYNRWTRHFRTDGLDRSYYKSLRHWESNPYKLSYIIRAYTLRPFEEHILPGICQNREMPVVPEDQQMFAALFSGWGWLSVEYTMPFDDTIATVRGYQRLVCLWDKGVNT